MASSPVGLGSLLLIEVALHVSVPVPLELLAVAVRPVVDEHGQRDVGLVQVVVTNKEDVVAYEQSNIL